MTSLPPEPADAKLLVNLDLAPWVIGKPKPRLGDTTFGEAARPAAALSPGRFPTARPESERLVPGHLLPLQNGSTPPACPGLVAPSRRLCRPPVPAMVPSRPVGSDRPAGPGGAGRAAQESVDAAPEPRGGPLPKAPIAPGEELLEALAGGRGDPNSSTFGKMGNARIYS